MIYDCKTRDIIKKRAKQLRKRQTGAEYHLRCWLKKNKEKRILRQCVVGKMIIDFGLPYRNLLIEVDDPTHKTRQERDARRDAWLRNLGFRILRVTNDEVFNSIYIVLYDKISAYSVSKENRQSFTRSIRAARAKSYWKLEK